MRVCTYLFHRVNKHPVTWIVDYSKGPQYTSSLCRRAVYEFTTYTFSDLISITRNGEVIWRLGQKVLL